MQHYKNGDPYEAQSYVVCINSLGQLNQLTDFEKEDYIIFIDELTSFLNFTHNDTLNNNIKYVYSMLSSLNKKAHKVITGDAVIFDNAFQFLQSRINVDKKTLYIKKQFQ
jgi:predicted house-cleaning NTP pyrophosphatase (Maf/HAM1 superfamily)